MIKYFKHNNNNNYINTNTTNAKAKTKWSGQYTTTKTPQWQWPTDFGYFLLVGHLLLVLTTALLRLRINGDMEISMINDFVVVVVDAVNVLCCVGKRKGEPLDVGADW